MMYSGVLTDQDVDDIVTFSRYRNMSMKLGMLAGTGGSCCGRQLMTFTSHGFAWGLLQHDRVTDFIMMLYSAANHAYSRGFWTAPESSSIDRHDVSVAYCSPSQGIVPLMLRWMLLFEDPHRQTVWIGKAIPRTFLEDGESVEVSNTTVSYGSVSFKYQSELSQSRAISIQLQVSLQHFPLKGMFLRVRPPGKLPIKSVTLNGQKWTNFNVPGEFIGVPATNEKMQFKVSY